MKQKLKCHFSLILLINRPNVGKSSKKMCPKKTFDNNLEITRALYVDLKICDTEQLTVYRCLYRRLGTLSYRQSVICSGYGKLVTRVTFNIENHKFTSKLLYLIIFYDSFVICIKIMLLITNNIDQTIFFLKNAILLFPRLKFLEIIRTRCMG